MSSLLFKHTYEFTNMGRNAMYFTIDLIKSNNFFGIIIIIICFVVVVVMLVQLENVEAQMILIGLTTRSTGAIFY